jgi:ribonuclease Z
MRLRLAQAGAEELEVVFLGTGAAMPSKYRNVTSIYINRFARGGMLLDCGEGTLGQLTRRFGRAKVKNILCSLACVWISHIHADHHAGLPRWFTHSSMGSP